MQSIILAGGRGSRLDRAVHKKTVYSSFGVLEIKDGQVTAYSNYTILDQTLL